MKVNWKNEKNSLERLISEGVPYERIGRQYGVTGNAVKKAARNLGIELEYKRVINPNEHFNKGKKTIHTCLNCGKEFEHSSSSMNKFCSIKCKAEYDYLDRVKRWKNGEIFKKGATETPSFIKKYLMDKFGNKCQICGWGETNSYTGKIPLHIHHIDGDCTNNKEENLQLLCPNCHSLTENYGSLNKNSSRFHRPKITNNMG